MSVSTSSSVFPDTTSVIVDSGATRPFPPCTPRFDAKNRAGRSRKARQVESRKASRSSVETTEGMAERNARGRRPRGTACTARARSCGNRRNSRRTHHHRGDA
eukprot:29317-Pelagococcus_subviridis.AAC.4